MLITKTVFDNHIQLAGSRDKRDIFNAIGKPVFMILQSILNVTIWVSAQVLSDTQYDALYFATFMTYKCNLKPVPKAAHWNS